MVQPRVPADPGRPAFALGRLPEALARHGGGPEKAGQLTGDGDRHHVGGLAGAAQALRETMQPTLRPPGDLQDVRRLALLTPVQGDPEAWRVRSARPTRRAGDARGGQSVPSRRPRRARRARSGCRGRESNADARPLARGSRRASAERAAHRWPRGGLRGRRRRPSGHTRRAPALGKASARRPATGDEPASSSSCSGTRGRSAAASCWCADARG